VPVPDSCMEASKQIAAAYEMDDGDLSASQIETIRKAVPQNKKSVIHHLFSPR
jgi:hypothetical protein